MTDAQRKLQIQEMRWDCCTLLLWLLRDLEEQLSLRGTITEFWKKAKVMCFGKTTALSYPTATATET
jgi:hypothetical protein